MKFTQSYLSSTLKIISALITISIASQMTIDIGSIPITGQTLALLIWAFFLTPQQAFLTLATYLLLGILGVPVFADGSFGFDKIVGGSGGFLIGFLIATPVVSYLYSRMKSDSFTSILALTTLGTIIILSFGVGRLATLYGLEKAIEYGFTPFWKGAIVKIILGSVCVWCIKKYVPKQSFSS